MDHECFLVDTAYAVRVTPSPIVVSIESRKALNGSRVTVYEEPRCESSCTSYELCHPAGLLNGDRYTIAEVMDEVTGPCEKGLALKKVELRQ